MGLFDHNMWQEDGSKYKESIRNDPIGHTIRELTGIGRNYNPPPDFKLQVGLRPGA